MEGVFSRDCEVLKSSLISWRELGGRVEAELEWFRIGRGVVEGGGMDLEAKG
jgi:hypothetical protein